MQDQNIDDYLGAIVRQRIAKNRKEIEHSLQQIAAGNPLGSEPSKDRLVNRIAKKTNMTMRDAEAMSNIIQTASRVSLHQTTFGPEAIQGPTIDFTGVEFLSRGRLAANAVGRITWKTGKAQGTGFLVAPGILITNNHVIEDAAQARQLRVEFDYELDELGASRPTTVFDFDPKRLFLADAIDRLDFTLIAVGPAGSGTKSIESFGYIPLSDASDKHMLGELANIIQHPLGSVKQVVVRENNLVSRDETLQVLHYLADTDRGSSGSPVCNNDWEPIALHHWGGPALETRDASGNELRRDINEGIRISAIVKALRQRLPAVPEPNRPLLARILALWDEAPRQGPAKVTQSAESTDAATPSNSNPRTNPDGSLTWTFPIEIRVSSPLFGHSQATVEPLVRQTSDTPAMKSEKVKITAADFADRGGYEPGFIPGFVVQMPDASAAGYPLAENKAAAEGDDPFELRYHHFSIKVNRERRLAAFTACNIDGSRTVAVNRQTKDANLSPTLDDLDLRPESAESTDPFQIDPRLSREEQMGVEFYEDQKVPDFDKPSYPGKNAPAAVMKAYRRAMNERTARMFQKGHIIMRGDPAWGTAPEAVAAEADTFFYTNAAPQLGWFNQGSPAGHPAAKGKLRWRALETYILRNAFSTRQRICVFAGPVFDSDYDVEYREGLLVPMRFWKIAVWAEGGALKSIALKANQKPVLELMTKGTPEAMEAFDDEDEIAHVSEFLSTVAEIESMTGLKFDAAIMGADIRAGQEDAPVTSRLHIAQSKRTQQTPPAKTKRRPPRKKAP